jgi:hypothetical protein
MLLFQIQSSANATPRAHISAAALSEENGSSSDSQLYVARVSDCFSVSAKNPDFMPVFRENLAVTLLSLAAACCAALSPRNTTFFQHEQINEDIQTVTPPPQHLRNASPRQSCERAWHGRHQQNRISNHSDKIVEQRWSAAKRARRRGLRNGECSGALLPEAPRVAHRSSAPASDSTFNSASIRIHSLNLGRIRTLCDDNECFKSTLRLCYVRTTKLTLFS